MSRGLGLTQRKIFAAVYEARDEPYNLTVWHLAAAVYDSQEPTEAQLRTVRRSLHALAAADPRVRVVYGNMYLEERGGKGAMMAVPGLLVYWAEDGGEDWRPAGRVEAMVRREADLQARYDREHAVETARRAEVVHQSGRTRGQVEDRLLWGSEEDKAILRRQMADYERWRRDLRRDLGPLADHVVLAKRSPGTDQPEPVDPECG